MIRFRVENWAGWAPGLESRQSWYDWARAPWIPEGNQTPALSEIPAMQRRRIERLGRLAIQVACWCEQGDGQDQVPMIFASRHGDIARSMELLQSLVAGESLSPTGFGLSVHNAIAALYSIARRSRANYQAIAAGEATVEAALIEAAAMLADGESEVRVVVFDAQLPAVYDDFKEQADPAYSWCWCLKPAQGAQGDIQLGWESRADAEAVSSTQGELPHGLAWMQFLLSDSQKALMLEDGPIRWHAVRHA